MRSLKITFATFIAAVSFAGVASAYTVNIQDTYIGGNNHGWSNGVNDAISLPADEFNISSMDVTFNSSNALSRVSINTTYIPWIGAYGTELGDLFIKTGKYNTPLNNNSDNFFTGTNIWNYALVLEGDRKSSAGGSLSLYQVDTSVANRNNFKLSEDLTSSSYIFRNGTLIEVNKTPAFHQTIGSWSTSSNQLNFDITDTSLLSGSDFSFHWAMSCGNDVIEGGASAPVPEPGTFLLLGIGLLGLGVYRKKMF